MTVRRATGPTGDPFWDTFLARHPGVDVVLLPPPDPGRPPADEPAGEPHDEAALAVLRDVVDGAVRHVAAAALGVYASPGEPDDAVMSGSGTSSVRARSLLVARGRGSDEVDLARAGAALGTRWGVELRDGVVGRLVARSRVRPTGPPDGAGVGLELVATWAPATGVLQVEATSSPVEVGAALAERLLAARRSRRTGGGAER